MTGFLYHVCRYLETGRGLVKQWLTWSGAWCIATNAAAGFPSARMARLNVETINADLSGAFIEGPRGGRHNLKGVYYARNRNH